jgi:hypothetical protein
MTDQREQERAAGYVYAYEAATNTQALLFGRGGTRRSEIVYRVTLTEDRAPSRQFELQMRGDFTPWLDHELINQIGQAPVAVQGQVDGQPFSVQFDPDPTTPGNALFRTRTGLHGAVIRTHNSPWPVLVFVAIAALADITLTALNDDTNLTVKVSVDTPVGDANVEIEVNGRPPGEGGAGK